MIKAEFKNEINDLVTENLYQWDTYQTLKISGIDFGTVAPRVHFANKKSTEALVVNGVLKDDGSVEVSIPNSLLSEKYDILAYIYVNTGLTSKTIKSITIPIIARLKPSEYYQPSNEDIAQIEAIELEAKAIIDGLTASEYDETETYKRPNIVYYDGSSYMCTSTNEISGQTPSPNSDYWVLISKGTYVTGVALVDNQFNFTMSDGESFSVPLDVAEVDVFSLDEYPLLGVSANVANNIIEHPNRSLYSYVENGSISKAGLYCIMAFTGDYQSGNEEHYTYVVYLWNTSVSQTAGAVYYNSRTKSFSVSGQNIHTIEYVRHY